MIDKLPLDFDPAAYLAINADVADARLDPVEHYLRYGRSEGRAYKFGPDLQPVLTKELYTDSEEGANEGLSPKHINSWRGFCPICQIVTKFVSSGTWYRDTMTCTTCEGGSVPRERALALVLEELFPQWRSLQIHESSPVWRGISLKLRNEAPHYVSSQYFPDRQLGSIVGRCRNEDLQNLTFESESHDLFISLDVFEHIADPESALREIYRTLKPGGAMLSTFPVRKWQVDGLERRTERDEKGNIIHLKEPEYHGNPVDPQGSIVTVDYGYDLHHLFAQWALFDVRVYRFADRSHGILGEYTEVILCRKPHTSNNSIL